MSFSRRVAFFSCSIRCRRCRRRSHRRPLKLLSLCLLPSPGVADVAAVATVTAVGPDIAAGIAAHRGEVIFTLLLLSSNQSADLLKIIFCKEFLLM